ncbi:MAG: P1 family peptidase, partial [Dialister sp.]|nr:P1 family peptidase [Dialister sp.]
MAKINVPGFKIGTKEDISKLTGVTVILAPKGGATAGVDVRGWAPGTRETDLLRPEKTVQKINAVVLSGGSAFGLEAASGCMKLLAEEGIGFRVGNVCVPIVCGAVLFDLMIGDSRKYPDLNMGYEAAESACTDIQSGCVGAGAGATVGKILGFGCCMKSGAGYHELQLENGVYLGAYVAVNACGEVFEDDKILAGVYDYQKQKILSSPELVLQG